MRGWIFIAAAVSAMAVAGASAGAQRGPSDDGLLVGQVVDATSGRPVSQAVVWLGAMPTATRVNVQAVPTRILTGSDGRFVFRNLPPGSYTVIAGKDGYLSGASGRRHPRGASRAIAVDANGRVGDVVVRMWKAASIAGTVFDESGEPLVRVQVTVLRKVVSGGRARYGRVQEIVTDDRGVYRAGGLPPGEYLVATAAPAIAFPSVMAGDFPALRDAGKSSGRAVTIGDFLVQLGAGIPTPPPVENGRFRTYAPTFHPGAASALQASVIAVGAGDEYSGADIQLQPTGLAAVHGQVIGPDVEGAPLLQLVRTDTEALAPSMPATLTPVAAGGGFVFPSVADGEYTLRVIGVSQAVAGPEPGAPRTLLWAADPVVVSGEDVTVPVVLREGVRIRGQVQFDGLRTQPPPGVLQRVPIAVEPAYGEPMLSTSGVNRTSSTRVDASGSFTTPGVPGGSYVVRVTNSPQGWMFAGAFSGGRDISSSPVDLLSDLDGVVVRFSDRWTGLQGTVRDAHAQPDSDATVFVFPLDPSDWVGYGPNPRRLRFTHTSATGAYAFDPLPPGDYYVIAVTEEPPEWRDPSVLERLSRSATRVTVRADGKTTMDLRTR